MTARIKRAAGWKRTWPSIKKPQPAPRTDAGQRACLACGESFEGEGIHSRICMSCRARNSTRLDGVPVVHGFGGRTWSGGLISNWKDEL